MAKVAKMIMHGKNCFKNITFYHILKPTVILLFLHLR